MGAKVLAVDDSDANLQLLTAILGQYMESCEVFTASTGEEALSFVAQTPPDLILLDAMMPGMNGFEVCRRLKENPRTVRIPVLMISGVLVAREDRISGMEKGAEGYICKPYQPEDVVAQVKSLLRMKAYEDDLRSREQALEVQLTARSESLRRSEQGLRDLFDRSPDAIFVEDLDGNVLDVNPAACRLHGLAREELVGRNVLDLVPPSERATIRDRFPEWRTGELQTYEGYSYTKEGAAVPVEIRGSHMQYGDTPALLLHVRDISQRKEMEGQLVRAQKLESVGVLAGGIAHDFNNLLLGIIGNLSFARTSINSVDPLQDVLIEAEHAALRARSLTQQLLTFSKGGTPIRSTASIPRILRETTPFVLTGSNSVCSLQIEDSLWPAFVDAGQISQVIENLVINADQAMPKGGTIIIRAENVTVTTETEGETASLRPGQYIRIQVADQGEGISPEALRQVFDPYFTTKKTGSGLGLAVCYSIVKKHEGEILVESELGTGTTFTIYLPVAKDGIAAAASTSENPVLGSGRVLLMDDETMLRKLVSRMLTSIGYDNETVRDGAEAVASYRAALETGQRFDAVILDLTVPGGMGGNETVEKLLELDPSVKAIVSSGYSDTITGTSFSEFGFVGVMSKPYDVVKLSQVLNQVLRG